MTRGTSGSSGSTGVTEQHHQLPRQYEEQFKNAGLEIEDYVIQIDKADHRLKPDGLHTGQENWNKQWGDFFRANPNANQADILNQLDIMQATFGLK